MNNLGELLLEQNCLRTEIFIKNKTNLNVDIVDEAVVDGGGAEVARLRG